MTLMYEGELYYHQLPKIQIGKLIVYMGKFCGKLEDLELPNKLHLLYDADNRENDLYFLDEPSLVYYLSENVGEALNHQEAKNIRKKQRSFIKSVVRIDNSCKMKVKDFVAFDIESQTVTQVWREQLYGDKRLRKFPLKRLKEQKNGKE